MFLFDRPRASNYRMDTLFYNSVNKAKNSYLKKVACNIFKIIMLAVFLIIDTSLLKTDQWKLVILMRLGIATSIINSIINLVIYCVGYRDNQSNNNFFLYLAQAVGHSALQEPVTNRQDFNNLKKCVSTTLYNANNGSQNNDPALYKQIRQKYENINKNLVEGQILQRHKCLPIIDLLGRILSLCTVIYGIVALFASKPSIYQLIVLVLYLILESIYIWMVILVILAIIFSPFICCFGCIYLICTRGSVFIDRQSLSIPEATKATPKMIQQTSGTCTICLQDFKLNEKIINLSCNSKHIFHENCIMSWLRVSNTCPICRKQVPQAI